MYSRNYFDTELPSSGLPENYVGTAFAEPPYEEQKIPEPEAPCDICEEKEEAATQCSAHATGPQSGSLFGGIKLPFLDTLKIPEIGTEEILIIAVALFLLFSKDGDRECAVMLLLLLLVN